ncbi:uncharacterized protein LOC116847683 [Odontomachus brunneus]|uniref:uncharacterized protein LOC116847683 n=1 Tax=Odontomachus brunneus TaxID=486640 RepID=UPI0013F23102|nr:uncharacterized protein LOC116847683 [Odontomachus brunneus]
MEILSCFKRVVNISEPILAEDSTCSTLSLSLCAVLEQLDNKKAIHHDYLVALLLVLLAESGFHALPTSESIDESSGSSISNHLERKVKKWNTKLVHISTNWKSQNSGLYEIYFVLLQSGIQSKLIVKPVGDKLILNMYPCIENKKIYSMVVKTLLYVNPYTERLCSRYRNLKSISHRFKNEVATPVRTDIFYSLRLTNPSLQGLPVELLMIIKQFLSEKDFKKMTMALYRC